MEDDAFVGGVVGAGGEGENAVGGVDLDVEVVMAAVGYSA